MTDDLDRVKRELGKKYQLSEDVVAALASETPQDLEAEAIRWAKLRQTGAPIPMSTEEALEKARLAGAERTLRLLDTDRKAAADDVDHEAVEAATNAAELAALGRQREEQADALRLIHPRREDRILTTPDERLGDVADLDATRKALEEAKERRLQGDPDSWREVDGE